MVQSCVCYCFYQIREWICKGASTVPWGTAFITLEAPEIALFTTCCEVCEEVMDYASYFISYYS